jgi:NADH-quinone oxidoreductase subunit N
VKAPFVLFILTGAAMIILSFTRRRHLLSGLLAGLFCLVIAVFVLYIPLDEALSFLGISVRFDGRWLILGRSFLLNQNNRASIGYVYIGGGLILVGAWTARPERMYYTLAMGILGLIAASLLIDPFLYAAIFIELAVIFAVIILSSRTLGRARGGLRLLSLYTLAMLAILLVGWSVDVSGFGLEMEGANTRLALLLGFGLATFLSIPPFHSWIPMAAEENHPFSWAFVAVVLQGAALFFLMRFIGSFTWIHENKEVFRFIRNIGATMAIIASLWSVLQEDFQKMASYALIADLGVMLVALGLGSMEGFQLALGLTGARVISMSCLSQGLMQLWKYNRREYTEEDIETVLPSPIVSAAILVGMLSIAGFPLTAGFPGRWSLLSMIAPLDRFAWIAIVGSMGVLCIAAFRITAALVFEKRNTQSERLTWKEKVFLGEGVFLTIVLGIFPQLLFPWIITALEGIQLPLL